MFTRFKTIQMEMIMDVEGKSEYCQSEVGERGAHKKNSKKQKKIVDVVFSDIIEQIANSLFDE